MQQLYNPENFLDSSCFSPVNALSDNSYTSYSSSASSMVDYRKDALHRQTTLRSGKVLSTALPKLVSLDPAQQEQLLRAAVGSQIQSPIPTPSATFPSGTSSLRIQTGQIPGDILASGKLLAALQTELENNVIDTVSGQLVDYLFPEEGCPVNINDAGLTKILISRNLWDRKKGKLYPPRDYKERTVCDWLNLIAEVMGRHLCRPVKRKWYDGGSTKPPSGSDYNRKPDLSLLDSKYLESVLKSDDRIDWRFIRSISEVTNEKTLPSRITNTITAKSFVMFSCQFDRRVVPALSFIGDGRIMLTVTDREGQMRFDCGNLRQPNLDASSNLLRILYYLMLGDISYSGLDPHFSCDKKTGSVISVEVDGKRFELIQRIYTLEKLLGRGTKVWIASHQSNHYIVKDSWIQANRVESEIGHLQHMLGCPELQGLVPQLFCGGDVIINGQPDFTGAYRTAAHGKVSARCLHRRVVTSPIGEPITNFNLKKEFISCLIDVITAHEILTDKLKILHHDVSINNVILCRPSAGKIAKGMIIDFDYAQTIKELLEKEVIADQAIESNVTEDTETEVITELEGILEPDVLTSDEEPNEIEVIFEQNSLDNSPVDDADECYTTEINISNSAKSFVTHTIPEVLIGKEPEQLWTGTPPFMVIEALISYGTQYTHKPRHDLESILYIILYTCTYLKKPKVFRKGSDIPDGYTIPLGRWFKQEYVKEIGRSKIGHLETANTAIFPKFAPYWDDFVPFVKELLAECFPVRVSEPNALTHANMKAVLQRALHTVREPALPTRAHKRSGSSSSSRSTKKTRAAKGGKRKEGLSLISEDAESF